MALPYGVLQKILTDSTNRESLNQLRSQLKKLPHDASNTVAGSIFRQARATIRALELPKKLEKEISSRGKTVSKGRIDVAEG